MQAEGNMSSRTKGKYKSKEALQTLAIPITVQHRCLEEQYDIVYQYVRNLEEAYQRSKRHWVPRRYGKLKKMIKSCTADKQDTSCTDNTVSLLQATKQFVSLTSEYYDVSNEVTQLKKADLKEDISKKQTGNKIKAARMKQIYDCAKDLQGKYEESKQLTPFKRYKCMKEMIKTFISQTKRCDMS